VGNAIKFISMYSDIPDHPHTRGERSGSPSNSESCSGSSPHAWGTLVAEGGNVLIGRIIPTRVGNAQTHCTRFGGRSDHPHTRGEREKGKKYERDRGGSSPHAWGTHQEYETIRVNVRIIPTRVGNAKSERSSLSRSTDHPHTRGERVDLGSGTIPDVGSSPHAWGTRHHRVT